jgi:hypothetical protein
MPIHPPPLKAVPSLIADWIEIRTLANENNLYRLNHLKRFWDTRRETEDSDPSGQRRVEDNTDTEGISGADEDIFLDAITDEISDRINALGDAYPFEFDIQGTKLSVLQEVSDAGYIYLFCLLLSHCKADEILNGEWLPAVNHDVRDLFQACATLAAAGYVDGCAISFGWPRPNQNPPFLQRLKDVYHHFGEGEVVNEPRVGASPMVKDEEIDVIAWKPRKDKAAGTFYLLGQVASGSNWEAKSIKGGPIAYFHRTWFTRTPASEPLPSIFIPQAVLPTGDGGRKDRIDLQTAKFGFILDRLVLPSLASVGISLFDDKSNDLIIERRSDIPRVIAWVSAQVTALRNSVSNLVQQ